MKKINVIIFIGMIFSAQSTFKVEGMTCKVNCASKVKTMTSSLDGVNSCSIDFEKSLMTVEYDDKKLTNNQIISQLSNETPYKFSMMDLGSNTTAQCAKSCCDTQCAKSCCGNKQEKKQSFFKKIFSWF